MSDTNEPIKNSDPTEPSPSENNDSGSKTAVQLFEEIHGFTSPLSQQMESIRGILAGLQEHNVSALSSLIDLHRLAFRMSVARDPEEVDESDSITTFLSAIAGELEPYVDIVIPRVYDTLDLDTMKVLDREITDQPDLHNTVCGILQCGYRANSIAGGNVLEKASVVAFKTEGVITAVETYGDAIVELEKIESENPADDETRQTTSWRNDYFYMSLGAFAALIVFVLFSGFIDRTDFTTLHEDIQTISDHVYAGRYDEARKLLDKHEEWGDLELWSKETRKYCNEREAKNSASDGGKALAPNKSTEAAEDNPDDAPAPIKDGAESKPIDNQTDNNGENSDTSQRAAEINEQ